MRFNLIRQTTWLLLGNAVSTPVPELGKRHRNLGFLHRPSLVTVTLSLWQCHNTETSWQSYSGPTDLRWEHLPTMVMLCVMRFYKDHLIVTGWSLHAVKAIKPLQKPVTERRVKPTCHQKPGSCQQTVWAESSLESSWVPHFGSNRQ